MLNLKANNHNNGTLKEKPPLTQRQSYIRNYSVFTWPTTLYLISLSWCSKSNKKIFTIKYEVICCANYFFETLNLFHGAKSATKKKLFTKSFASLQMKVFNLLSKMYESIECDAIKIHLDSKNIFDVYDKWWHKMKITIFACSNQFENIIANVYAFGLVLMARARERSELKNICFKQMANRIK